MRGSLSNLQAKTCKGTNRSCGECLGQGWDADEKVREIRKLRKAGDTVPSIIKATGLSKASIYRALG